MGTSRGGEGIGAVTLLLVRAVGCGVDGEKYMDLGLDQKVRVVFGREE